MVVGNKGVTDVKCLEWSKCPAVSSPVIVTVPSERPAGPIRDEASPPSSCPQMTPSTAWPLTKLPYFYMHQPCNSKPASLILSPKTTRPVVGPGYSRACRAQPSLCSLPHNKQMGMSAGILSPGSVLSPLVRITGSHCPGLLPLMVSLALILAAVAGFFLTEANNLPLLDTTQETEKSWDPPHTTPCGLWG